jgi:hypothetical protein
VAHSPRFVFIRFRTGYDPTGATSTFGPQEIKLENQKLKISAAGKASRAGV